MAPKISVGARFPGYDNYIARAVDSGSAQAGAPVRKAGPIEILRDEYGVPHIFANSLEDAAYAIGYAQAEDRLEELLRNYRKAEGTMSEAFGPEWYRHDYIQRVWQHAAISRRDTTRSHPGCVPASRHNM
ncbi:MAG: penicillin acylase family protein [Acidobacteria bacterium]|nr:penicillin acylase family protein [Acidobacteriota bacterium]